MGSQHSHAGFAEISDINNPDDKTSVKYVLMTTRRHEEKKKTSSTCGELFKLHFSGYISFMTPSASSIFSNREVQGFRMLSFANPEILL